jgi:small subunit ribosomal protein S20
VKKFDTRWPTLVSFNPQTASCEFSTGVPSGVANTKQAIKMIRVAERRRKRNRPIRTAVRTYIRSAKEAIVAAPAEADTVEAVKQAISQLDRAAAKGVIHGNNAARRKSRLMRRLNAAQVAVA